MRGYFVTGTDTGVGKTRVAAGLLHACARHGLKAVGMKPVASGAVPTAAGLRNDDALLLQRSAGVEKPYALVNPYCFAPPVAPHLAAREAGVEIRLPVMLTAFTELCAGAELAVVEGVGGWQVPLSESLSLPDLARAMGLPVLLVVGLRLGCLNHALLTARAVRADGLALAGWIANGVDAAYERPDANVAALETRLEVPLLGRIPHAAECEPKVLAEALAAAVKRLE